MEVAPPEVTSEMDGLFSNKFWFEYCNLDLFQKCFPAFWCWFWLLLMVRVERAPSLRSSTKLVGFFIIVIIVVILILIVIIIIVIIAIIIVVIIIGIVIMIMIMFSC